MVSQALTHAEVEYALNMWSSYESLVLPQLASFDRFLECRLKDIIMENSDLKIENDRRKAVHEIKFSNGSVGDCPDKSDAINMTKSASLAYL